MSEQNGQRDASSGVQKELKEQVVQKYIPHRRAIIAGNGHAPMVDEVMRHLKNYSGKYAPGETIFFEQPPKEKIFKNAEFLTHVGGSVRESDYFIIATPRFIEGYFERDNESLRQQIRSSRNGFTGQCHVILTSTPFARQDRITLDREFPSLRLFLDGLLDAGATTITAFELHNDATVGYVKWGMQNLRMINFIGKIIKDDIINKYNPTGKKISLVTPDFGGAKFLEKVSEYIYKECGLDLNVVFIQKHRDPSTGETTIKRIVGEPTDICILVDDMVDTAGTAANASVYLKENYGVDKTFMVGVHPIFGTGAEENLKRGGFEHIFTSDSCYSPDFSPQIENHTPVSMAKMVAGVIDNIHNQGSVTTFVNRY